MSPGLFPERRGRRADCVSDYQLDKLVGNLLPDDHSRALRGHLEGCVECAARLRTIEEERFSFASRPLPIQLGHSRSRSRSRWLYGAGASGGALALVAVALLMLRSTNTPDEATRTKGKDGVGFVIVGVNRQIIGDETHAVAHPGDELQWRIRVTSPKYVAVLSRDAAGASSIYFPDGERATYMTPGAAANSATKLDAVIGGETLYTLICTTPVDLEPLRRELESRGTFAQPAGCQMKLLSLRKEL